MITTINKVSTVFSRARLGVTLPTLTRSLSVRVMTGEIANPHTSELRPERSARKPRWRATKETHGGLKSLERFAAAIEERAAAIEAAEPGQAT